MSKVEEIRDKLTERYSESKARIIIESLKEDAQEAGKSLEELLEEAGNIITDLDLSAYSGVESPAQNSSWFLMKSKDGLKFQSTSPMYFRKEEDDERQISYAEVLRPSEVDKQDDLIPSRIIEEAAHEFLEEGNINNIDINHDGITGKGKIVESYIVLEEHTPFIVEDHNGEEKEIPKGTWVSAVKWNDEVWPHVKNGDLEGFSIFGEGDGLELDMSKKMIEDRIEELVKKGRERGYNLSVKSYDKNIKGQEDNIGRDNMSEEDIEEGTDEENADEEEKEATNDEILEAISDLKSTMAEVKEAITREDSEDEEDGEDEEDDEEKTDEEIEEEEELEDREDEETEEKVKHTNEVREENLEVEDSNEEPEDGLDYEKIAQKVEKKMSGDEE